ncbi:MAG: sulfite exporter TauE/SafE family protein, partial [Thermoplasmata archaeon]|nr:sulfite exporter TauE/SafE family protein [Thermoplasmata archaeon]
MDQGFLILILLSFLTGTAAGYLSGLLGIGAGMLLVPASIFLLKVDFREAKILSLFVIMFTSPFGMLRHRSHGNLHSMTGFYLGAPGVMGCLMGVYIGGKLDTTILELLFALLLFYTAHRMIFGGRLSEKP